MAVHSAAAALRGRAAALRRRVAALRGRAGVLRAGRLAGNDLVHFDFHPENVLVDAAGAVTGVVDWDGAGRGNAALDLYTLRFDLARRAPELGRRVAVAVRETMPEDVVAACWAHLSLRLVDWSIRHLTPGHVSTWLAIAEELRP